MTIHFAQEALREAGVFLESVGAFGREGTGMLAGRVDSSELVVERFFAPDQRAGEYPTCWVEVTSAGKRELALALGHDERWLARIHSHPFEAFHSTTDDANPGLTAERAISIVVPYFGLGLRRGLDACALFQRRGGRWLPTTVAALDLEITG